MQDHIRNFAIIAHIDHGKSTLCDRLLELTGTVAKRDMRAQILDSNPIERERGITIKLAPVRMVYHAHSTHESHQTHETQCVLNLIDTPGHVDFSYEVSRSLAACEGAILVVDATQGVQAQTLANLRLAREHNLTIIPVINKIDLPNARVAETVRELEGLGFPPLLSSPNPSYPSPTVSLSPVVTEVPLLISAKTGQGVPELLDAIITRIPPPSGAPTGALRALVFSSQYDPHKGVVVFVRVVDGEISFARPGLAKLEIPQIRFLASGSEVTPIEVGYFNPQMVSSDGLRCGEVGYIATGLKDVRLAKVGDTITTAISDKRKVISKIEDSDSDLSLISYHLPPLPGYQEPKPMVFLGLYPMDSSDTTRSREAMERLRLSDSSFSFRPIHSLALGNGFHCGFLGLLHAEIVQERLSREFGLNMIATAPSVEYRVKLNNGVIPANAGIQSKNWIPDQVGDDKLVRIQSASEFPDPTYIEGVKEPIMQVSVYAPSKYVGSIMGLCQEKRGDFADMKYYGASQQYLQGVALQNASEGSEHDIQVELIYLIPLSEMIIDFFDRLKSVSEGYASLDYEFYEFQPVDVVKIDILVNHEKVDALSFLVVRDQAHHRSIAIVDRLAKVIPRQQFTIPIQGAIGGQIVARADVKAFRKDVIQKLYGGDRTRKDKLLKKQKKGKERMKMVGNVQIPQTAFFEVLKRD
ncbi:elongation factor 4 [Candidatus Gottesmanbacteria bacterium]|nr:elongation factor 4 [Candidatus Gottesmanbacteria bacterium]